MSGLKLNPLQKYIVWQGEKNKNFEARIQRLEDKIQRLEKALAND